MIYGYARVSTRGQARDGNSLEAQENALRAAGAEKVYADAFTGTKMDRPQLQELLAVLREGDMLVVTKLDRIARSATAGFELIEELIKKGVRVHILNMGLLDDSATGRLTRHVMLCFAEFEREQIQARCNEGKIIARQRPGYHEGRPQKYKRPQREHVLELLRDHSYSQAARICGMSRSTVVRIVKESRANGRSK